MRFERRQLYCIGGLPRGWVEFGISIDPEQRARELGGRLVGAVPCGMFVERLLHEALAEHRAFGEHYWPTPPVLRMVRLFRARAGGEQEGTVDVLPDPWDQDEPVEF